MNYQQALETLRQLKENFYKLTWDRSLGDAQRRELREKVAVQYGEIEEVFIKIAGIQKVEVEGTRGHKATYSSYLEAAVLSPWTYWENEAYQQLLKVIGKIEQLARDPSPLQVEHSVTNLVQILSRFRECCQYIKEPPANEKAVQDIMWIMLRSQFDRVDREETLPRFGLKNYRPDFGIPDVQVLVEAKYVGERSNVGNIQEEILADISGYINDSTKYKSIVVLVYDAAHKLRDSRKFIEDLKSVEGVVEVIVVPGIWAMTIQLPIYTDVAIGQTFQLRLRFPQRH